MGSSLFFSITVVIYLIATVAYILYAVFKKENLGKFATWTLAIGLAVQTIALILRTV